MEDYTETEIYYLISNSTYGLNNIYVPSELRQIYDEVDLLNKDNIYEGFISILEDNFNIDSNIVEVGSGVIPTLAKKISLKLENGTISVYDPRLTKNTNENKKYELNKNKIILKREEFNNNTNISNADILIGFMPCQATKTIIESACNNKKDFLIALCEGGYHASVDYYSDEEWHNYILDFASKKIKENNLGLLEIASLEKYGDNYPVIYNKRK